MNLSADPSMSYIAMLLFLIGLFLFISGLNIIKIEKIIVSHGFKTWSIGLVLMVVGIVIGIKGDIIENPNEKKPSSTNSSYSSKESKKLLNENNIEISPSVILLMKKLKNISNGKFSLDQLVLLIDIGEDGFYRASMGVSDYKYKEKLCKKLKSYNLIEIKYEQNTINDNFTLECYILPKGEEIYASVMNELTNNIDYERYFEPLVFPDKSIKYKNIKSSFDNLSKNEVVYMIHTSKNLLTTYADPNSEDERILSKLSNNGLFKITNSNCKYANGRICYSPTSLGKQVKRQMLSITKKHLDLK